MKRKRSRFDRLMLPTLAAGAILGAAGAASAVTTNANVWINELHYDNTGTDSNEFIEIMAPAGLTASEVANISIVLYNGSNGQTYDTKALSSFTVGATIGDFKAYSFTYPVNGIQNGNPDGVALLQNSNLLMFLSYGGTFAATNGPAISQTSTNIGAIETGTGATTGSIQLSGTGNSYLDFGPWVTTATNTKGALNENQTLTAGDPLPPPPPPPTPDLMITGIVDGPLTGGSPKFIELFALKDIASLGDFSISRYANGATAPTTQALPAVQLDEGQFIYLVPDAATLAEFNSLFPGKTAIVFGTATGNGDDVFQLLLGANPIDIFGVIGQDGSTQPWDYEDSYAFRNDGFGPNIIFTLNEWTFGGANALDPFSSDRPGLVNTLNPLMGRQIVNAAIPEPVTFTFLVLGGAALFVRRNRAA